MYTRFFGLNEKPFDITPNPRYLYMSERHAEALAHLMYGLNEAGGFVQLTGEVGTGKTTIIRTLLEQLPQHADVALILNPNLNPLEFLQTICQELGIAVDHNSGSKQLIDVLNAHLLDKHAKSRRVVVIVDEAQNLAPQTLEQVRMLTNLESATHKLLQIILIGQPELREVLAQSSLRQLAQRITGRYHLTPLSHDETAAYVWHRMKVAGTNMEIFNAAALREIHRRSGGVPRLINIICDRALLGAYTLEQHEIDSGVIKQAADEVAGHWRTHGGWPWIKWSMATVMAVAVISIIAVVLHQPKSTAVPLVVNTTEKLPPPKPMVVDINTLFNQLSDTSGTDSALTALFALWHITLSPDAGTACEQASVAGLECVYQKGVWSQLIALNRPTILQLNDDTGAVHKVVLAGLQNGNAQVAIGNTLHEVTITSLARYWNGDYLLLWKPPVSSPHPLSLGMRSPDVAWVRSALNTTQIESTSSSSDASNNVTTVKIKNLFDESLFKQVVEFQRTHHLNSDGVVGVQTQIALDALLNTMQGPLLTTHPNT